MPWEHCGRELTDDEPCACGLTKEQWTVEFNVTRSFRVRRAPALRVLAVDADEAPLAGERWRATLGDAAREGVLDDLGTARIPWPEGLDQATVAFPDRRPGELVRWRGDDDDPADEPAAASNPEGDACAFTCAPGRRLALQAARQLVVRLQLDPANPATEDDRYTLFLANARERWSLTLTPEDDAEPGDRWLTLRFTGLPGGPDERFSLEIDPGAEGAPYLAVEGLRWADLTAGARRAPHDDAGDDAGEDADEPLWPEVEEPSTA